MAELRPHYIDVDLKKNTQYNVPVVTQNDTATHFIIQVTDDGLSDPELLDAYQEITMTSQRPDGKSFYLTGTRIPGTNEIEFHLGTDETAFSGSVLASLQFYLVEDASRYTSAQFRYDVKKDLTTNYTPTQREETLVEVVLRDGPVAIQEAKDAKVAVDGALVELEQDKTAAIDRLDEVTEENKTVFQQPVNTFADLATTYPNPEHGTTVRVTGESATYRYSDGSWVKTDEYNPTAIDQVTAQLAEKVSVKIFEAMPSPSQLLPGELGLLLLPPLPFSFSYSFAGVDGMSWDGEIFKTTKLESVAGSMDQAQSVADIEDNTGRIVIAKSAVASTCTVDSMLTTNLNFTGDNKYKINLDMQRHITDGVNKGNCGISLSPSDNLRAYYPTTNLLTDGYSVFFASESASTNVLVRVRKIVGGTMLVDQFLKTGGGYTSVNEERLRIPQGSFQNVDLIVSATSVKLTIDGIVYLDLNEDLTVLNTTTSKLVLWGINLDANSLLAEHRFDNLTIDEVV